MIRFQFAVKLKSLLHRSDHHFFKTGPCMNFEDSYMDKVTSPYLRVGWESEDARVGGLDFHDGKSIHFYAASEPKPLTSFQALPPSPFPPTLGTPTIHEWKKK